jgi:hypothetical protein
MQVSLSRTLERMEIGTLSFNLVALCYKPEGRGFRLDEVN